MSRRGAYRPLFLPTISALEPPRPAMDEVVTYEDVAKWLRPEIREAIEATAPCTDGGRHQWEHRQIETRNLAEARSRFIHHWQCEGCGLDIGQDPAKLINEESGHRADLP